MVNKFICPLCKGVLSNPIIPCKSDFKVYCKNCINKYLENNENKCPNCHNIADNNPQQFDIVGASISCLDTFCKNTKSGCKWQGKYAFYEKHILECPKEEIHCIFKGCDKIFLRERLDSHLKICPFRLIVCEKCGMNIIASQLLKHRDECPKEIIKCPQKCGLKLERNKFNEHKEKCPFTLIKCPFEKIGCNENIMRSEFYKKMHDNMSKHLNLFLIDYLNYKENAKNIWKQHGIEFESKNFNENKQKEKNEEKIKDEQISNVLKKLETTDENKNEEKKKIKEINIKLEENNIKNSPLIEEEKNEEKFVSISKDTNLKNIISVNLNQNQIKPNQNLASQNNIISEKKENLLIEEKKELHLLNKKRERSEEKQENQNNSKQIETHPTKNNEISNNIIDKKNEQNTYNSNEISKKFTIDGNIIGSNCLEGNVHYFVFAHDSRKIKKDSEGDFIIKFEILEDVNWLSFGLCDKKIVENNEFTFSGKFSNNGYFYISTNNVIWHCEDLKQRKKVENPPNIDRIGAKGNIIECKYTPSSSMLVFYVNKEFLAGLFNVKPLQSDYLIPCLVFLKNCSVKTTFEYP